MFVSTFNILLNYIINSLTQRISKLYILSAYMTLLLILDDNCVHYSTCSGGDTKHNASQPMEDLSPYVYSAKSTILCLKYNSLANSSISWDYLLLDFFNSSWKMLTRTKGHCALSISVSTRPNTELTDYKLAVLKAITRVMTVPSVCHLSDRAMTYFKVIWVSGSLSLPHFSRVGYRWKANLKQS